MTSSTTLRGMIPEVVLHSIENDIDKIVVQSRDTDFFGCALRSLPPQDALYTTLAQNSHDS